MCGVLLQGKNVGVVMGSLHSLSLSRFIRLVLVRPLLGICRIKKGMYIGRHARPTGRWAGGV